MDENTRVYLRYLLNSTQNSQENSSSQNPQIPPTHQYPHPFPTMQFPPQNLQNFQGFGNFMSHPNYIPRGPQQPLSAEYWQNTSHPQFTPPVLQGFGFPHTTGTHFSSSMPTEPASPTFVPETQLSDRESPIEVVNLEKTVPDAEGTRKRSTWTKVEDAVLARSFVTISDDPIIGNDQKADAFWGRVASYYNDNRPACSNNRKANVIRSHWHNTIQKKVNRFNANYNSIYSLDRSCHSDEDILRFAYEKYREENNGVAFNLEHVWRIVKDRPMFTLQSDDHFVATKKTKTSESGASNTSSNQNVSIDIDDKDTRPMGRKEA
ncbi:glutathione S-transferase T3-like [Henckelia pumila]|uniref:glutathione S-transferase T3-like n=1 Tax=Henckelia pumila TaxID=405737 RepID=UPI003C6E27D3